MENQTSSIWPNCHFCFLCTYFAKKQVALSTVTHRGFLTTGRWEPPDSSQTITHRLQHVDTFLLEAKLSRIICCIVSNCLTYVHFFNSARRVIQQFLPSQLRDNTFAACLADQPEVRQWLAKLFMDLEDIVQVGSHRFYPQGNKYN